MKQLVTKGGLTVSDTGEIAGIAWLFGEPDRYGDTIEKGALAFPDRLPILWSHKDENAIGVWDSIKETARGLEVRGRLLLDEVPLAKRVFALIKSGAVSSLSVGFWPLKTDKNSTGGNHISAGDLVEISIVSAPAHPGATITSIKSAAGRKGTNMAKAAIKRKELVEDNGDIEAIVEEVIEESTLEDRVTALETDVAEITPAHSQPGGSHVVPENKVAITAGNNAVRYPHLVEYGAEHAEAQPFFWPAYRLGKKKAVAKIKRGMRKAIKEAK